jgi:hypothetical protein
MREDTMNTHFKRTLIALAVASFFVGSLAYADDGDWYHHQKPSQGVAGVDSTQSTSGNKINNKAGVHNDSAIEGTVGYGAAGNVGANVASGDSNEQSNATSIVSDGSTSTAADNFAFTANSQSNHDNDTHNDKTVNTAAISNDAFQNASGNVGANVASGDNNSQSNETALATDASKDDDVSFAFSGDKQSSSDNSTWNHGGANNAGVIGSAFQGAGGNLGIDVVSGDDNEQLNALSASVGTINAYALAVSTVDQSSHGNNTSNDPSRGYCGSLIPTDNNANLEGSVFASAQGNIGVNVAAGNGNLQSNTLTMGVTGSP